MIFLQWLTEFFCQDRTHHLHPETNRCPWELFLSIKCHPTTETVGWFLLLFLYPFPKKSWAEFHPSSGNSRKKIVRFQLLGPAETKKFLPISHRSHHITGKTSRSHLDTCHQTRPWSIQLHQLHSSHGQCYPSRIPASVVEWTCFGKPWIPGSLDPPDFFKCFLYVCEKDAYRYLYKCLKCS